MLRYTRSMHGWLGWFSSLKIAITKLWAKTNTNANPPSNDGKQNSKTHRGDPTRLLHAQCMQSTVCLWYPSKDSVWIDTVCSLQVTQWNGKFLNRNMKIYSPHTQLLLFPPTTTMLRGVSNASMTPLLKSSTYILQPSSLSPHTLKVNGYIHTLCTSK